LSSWLALVGLIIWDTRPSRGGQVTLADSEQRKTEIYADDQSGLSPDFKALIHTIRREGRAYRKEEQREDRAKRFREWITIALIALTFIAVCYQVHEIIKVYDPIRDQDSKLPRRPLQRYAPRLHLGRVGILCICYSNEMISARLDERLGFFN
jgi:hypothetical protein